MNVENGPNEIFERIKKKLYIRSPRHVADKAVTATEFVARKTILVKQLDLERRFYELEFHKTVQDQDLFSPRYNALREMAVHPEASEALRQHFRSQSVSPSVFAAANRNIYEARRRLREIRTVDLTKKNLEIQNIKKSLAVGEKILKLRREPIAKNPFEIAGSEINPVFDQKDKEARLIHDHYCMQ